MIQADTASNDFPADIVTPAHVATLITPGLSPVSICDARDRGASRLDPRVTASHELRITVELDEPDPKDAR